MRVAQFCLDATQAEDDFAIPFAGEIFRGVERFAQRNSEPAFQQHRKILLPSDDFQELEILRIARADLQHHSGRLAGCVQRFVNLINL